MRLSSVALALAFFSLPACASSNVEDTQNEGAAIRHEQAVESYASSRLLVSKMAMNRTPEIYNWDVYLVDDPSATGTLSLATNANHQVTYAVFVNADGKTSLIAFNAEGRTDTPVPSSVANDLMNEFDSLSIWIREAKEQITDAKLLCVLEVGAIGVSALVAAGLAIFGGWAIFAVGTEAGAALGVVTAADAATASMYTGVMSAAVFTVDALAAAHAEVSKTCSRGFGG